MSTEEAKEAMLDALEERKLMLQLKLVTTPPECRAEIVEDIEACRSLLVKVEENFSKRDERTTVH